MSKDDEIEYFLSDLDEEYPTDKLEVQFELDTIKAKKVSVHHDSDEEYDPQTDPYNILASKGPRGNTKRPVIKSSSKKPKGLPKVIDLDVASTSAITSIQEPTYILLASSNKSTKRVAPSDEKSLEAPRSKRNVNIHSKDDAVERSSKVSSDKSPEADRSLEVSIGYIKAPKGILTKDLLDSKPEKIN